MKHIPDLSEASIYVGTYHKYNCGSIQGDWLPLSEYSDKDEFYDACRELHSDEDDPEFMFQDWENIPDGLVGESWLSDNFFALRDVIDGLDSTETEAFLTWLDHGSYDICEDDPDDLYRNFQDEYQGQFSDEEDFAYDMVEQCYELPEFAKTYFDYEKFARDLFMCDYWMEDGYVFRTC